MSHVAHGAAVLGVFYSTQDSIVVHGDSNGALKLARTHSGIIAFVKYTLHNVSV